MSSSLPRRTITDFFLKIAALLFFIFFSRLVSAATSLDVAINEISWAGTEASYNDEWIELYNNKNEIVSLEGWKMEAEDGTPKILLTGKIAAYGFYLLERTDDNTLPDVSADKIYVGTLENAGEFLKLSDDSGNLIDSVNCSDGWFAGDNSSKQTMERKNSKASGDNPDDWQTSSTPKGTPKTINSQGKTTADVEKNPAIEFGSSNNLNAGTSTEKELFKNYPDGIVINEILPSPTGPDEQNEWIEIFNQNDFEADLSGWKIKDSVGKITSYVFPEKTFIKAKGFLIFYRPATKIVLNNDEDGLIFSRPDGRTVDEIYYQKAPQGKSFNRFDSDWLWSEILTPGSINNANNPIFPEKKTEAKQTKEEESVLENEITIRKTGAISEKLPKNKNFLPVLLIALTIAFFWERSFRSSKTGGN